MSDAWTAIPDEAWDKAVASVKLRGGRGTAMLAVLAGLYRLCRNAIHLGQAAVDEDGRLWFPLGSRLISERTSVSPNHVCKVVNDLAELGLLEVRKNGSRKRPTYHLTLYSPSTQMKGNLHTQDGRSVHTVYSSSETHKESLTTTLVEKKARPKLETAPRRADSKRARFLDQVRGWKPTAAKPGLLVVDKGGLLLEEAVGAIDTSILQGEGRLDLEAYWSYVKTNANYRGDKADLWDEWMNGNSCRSPGCLWSLHRTKPGKAWLQELFRLLIGFQGEAEWRNEDGERDIGIVVTSRQSIGKYLKIPSHWDNYELEDLARRLRKFCFEEMFTTITA